MHPVASFLKEHGIRLDKNLGQHFLIDDAVLEDIVAAAKIESTDYVVEIGPGTGVLTVELLKRAARVTAIELDPRMVPLLHRYVGQHEFANKRVNELTSVEGNALHAPFPEVPYKIVANIPYQITSPLLRHAFLESRPPQSLTLLIQREVAEKIARPYEIFERKNVWDNAGILTILVGLFGRPHIVRAVPTSAFLPPPKVESAILHIDCFPEPIAGREIIEEVFRLTKIAFAGRRKMLRNTLGAFPDLAERLLRLKIDPKRRPQTLSVQEWVALAEK